MLRSPRALLLAASLVLTACSANDTLRSKDVETAAVHLTTGATTLTSLGDTALVSARALDPKGTSLDSVPLRWSVTPNGILQKDAEGVYRAIGNGRATIVAEVDPGQTGVRPDGYWAGRRADSVIVEVRQRAARLTLAPVDTAFGTLGAARSLRATVTDARGNALLDGTPTLMWWAADPRVVQVDGGGVVRSLGEGASRVTVQLEQLSASAMFSVQPRLPHTSCMIFAQRKQTKQSCVTLDFTLRERGVTP